MQKFCALVCVCLLALCMYACGCVCACVEFNLFVCTCVCVRKRVKFSQACVRGPVFNRIAYTVNVSKEWSNNWDEFELVAYYPYTDIIFSLVDPSAYTSPCVSCEIYALFYGIYSMVYYYYYYNAGDGGHGSCPSTVPEDNGCWSAGWNWHTDSGSYCVGPMNQNSCNLALFEKHYCGPIAGCLPKVSWIFLLSLSEVAKKQSQ